MGPSDNLYKEISNHTVAVPDEVSSAVFDAFGKDPVYRRQVITEAAQMEKLAGHDLPPPPQATNDIFSRFRRKYRLNRIRKKAWNLFNLRVR